MSTPPIDEIDGAGPSPLPPRSKGAPAASVPSARFDDQQLVKTWLQFLTSGSKTYKQWADEFEVERLEQMFYGFQWSRQGNELNPEQRYVVNLFFSDLETKVPGLLFNRPGVIAQARPPFADDPGTDILQQVQLLKDTADTIVTDPRSNFRQAHRLALKDSFFRFGVIGAFYDQNPLLSHVQADLPPRKYGTKGVGADGESDQEVVEGVGGDAPTGTQTGRLGDSREEGPAEDVAGDEDENADKTQSLPLSTPTAKPDAPVDARVFFRWIPSKQFRVSQVNHNNLMECSWCGFYEWFPMTDVRDNPHFDAQAREMLVPGATLTDDTKMDASKPPGRSTTASTAPSTDTGQQYVQVWWIWDMREKKRMVVTPSSPLPLLSPEPYTTLPFSTLTFYDRLGSFYPVPPCWNWKHPQREINQEREDARIHRRRFYRRYLMKDGVMKEEEMSKLETGGDGVIVKVDNLGNSPLGEAIQPVQDAPRDPQNFADAQVLMTDMRMMSNIGGEQKGTADSKTATQAALVETNARLRQSAEKEVVALWVGESITNIIKLAIEFYPSDFWIKTNVDIYGVGGAEEALRVGGLWKQIKLKNLDEFEWEIAVDVESLTPETSDVQKTQWSQVLGLFSQPQIMLFLLCSDMMLRKTLALYGVRSSKDVLDIKRAMQVCLLAQGLQVAVAAAEQMNQQSMLEDQQGPAGGGLLGMGGILGGVAQQIGGGVGGGVGGPVPPGGAAAQIGQGGVGATATPGVGSGAPNVPGQGPTNPLAQILSALVGQGGGMQGGMTAGGGR